MKFTHTLLAILSLLIFASCSGTENEQAQATERPLRVMIISGENEKQLYTDIINDFESKHSFEVEYLVAPESSSEMLTLYHQIFGSRFEDIDLYMLDVVWPSIFATHLVDLKPALGVQTRQFIPEVLEANQVSGRLVSVPQFINTGIMFYRPSILEKYGYDQPPKTWDELKTMSEKITAGEQDSGNSDFYAYAWQGAQYEGLTCNIMEWIESEGGGVFNEEGRLDIANENSIRAIERAASWVGTISSPKVLTWKESDVEAQFMNGNAAFIRTWPTSQNRMLQSEIGDDFEIAPLPKGSKKSAAVIGGWCLGISRYSPRQTEAKIFLRFLMSEEKLKTQTISASLLPPKTALYSDVEIQESMPWISTYTDIIPGVVTRPTVESGNNYGEVSATIFSKTHEVLSGDAEAKPALNSIERELAKFLY